MERRKVSATGKDSVTEIQGEKDQQEKLRIRVEGEEVSSRVEEEFPWVVFDDDMGHMFCSVSLRPVFLLSHYTLNSNKVYDIALLSTVYGGCSNQGE